MVEVLAISEDIRCLGKRNQCREGKDRIGAIQYLWIDSMRDMTISKCPSPQGKVRLQGKEAKEGVALVLEISACQIQENGVTICPALEETHLGNSLIYKPKKVFGRKSQITGKTSSRMASVRVWEVSFSDLGKPVNFQLSVEGDLVRE